jgi:hypothetical protein
MPAVSSFISSRPSPITPPSCQNCSTQMFLVRLEPDAGGAELQMFECPECQHSESLVVKSAYPG